MNDKRLLKCPFCGGEATTYKTISHFNTQKYSFGVICKETPFCCTMTGYSTEEEAIAAWNNRKPVKNVLARLKNNCEMAMRNSEKAAELGEKYEKHMILQGAKGMAYETAIEIIKGELL